jgi:hypothetical protein
MKSTKSFIQIISAIFLIFSSIPSWAGSNSNQQAVLEPSAIKIFSKNIEKYAASQGARAFIIARAGRPEKDLPKGIKFTHTAIAVYSEITLTNGEQVQGYAIHNLYQKEDELNKSSLVVDYPVDFFWGVQTLKAGIIIPTPQLQQRLIEVIASGKNKQVHNENYSVIANPLNNQFQNCTEHTLNVINAAIYQTTDIDRLKANAKAYFKPIRVKISPFKLMLGKVFMDDVTTKDHPNKIYTSTFSTIAHYLNKNELLEKAIIYKDNQVTPLI